MSELPDWLERELVSAETVVRSPHLQGRLAVCRRATDPPSIGLRWGAAQVEFSGLQYQPVPDGEPTIIVLAQGPRFRDIDLVACAWCGHRTASRRGLVAALGEEWIDFVRGCGDDQLTLVSHPIRWLSMRGSAANILDWSQAPALLQGFDSVLCDSGLLARRVHAATRRMFTPPRLLFPKGAF